jgi:intraflagellar transport protein 172
LLTLAHFYAIRSACRDVDGLESLAAKLSIALLRFTDVIPSDKAYYEAGMDAKVNKFHEMFMETYIFTS